MWVSKGGRVNGTMMLSDLFIYFYLWNWNFYWNISSQRYLHLFWSSRLSVIYPGHQWPINQSRRSRGVDEIDFDGCFEAGISWWKDAKSKTKNTKTKAHPQIRDWHPRVNWFPNASGTPTTTTLTSTHTHPENVCVRLNQVLIWSDIQPKPHLLLTGRIALRHFDHAAYALNRSVHAECLIFWFRLVRWPWCDGTWLEVRKLHLFPNNFAPGCVMTLDALDNCVVSSIKSSRFFIVNNSSAITDKATVTGNTCMWVSVQWKTKS